MKLKLKRNRKYLSIVALIVILLTCWVIIISKFYVTSPTTVELMCSTYERLSKLLFAADSDNQTLYCHLRGEQGWMLKKWTFFEYGKDRSLNMFFERREEGELEIFKEKLEFSQGEFVVETSSDNDSAQLLFIENSIDKSSSQHLLIEQPYPSDEDIKALRKDAYELNQLLEYPGFSGVHIKNWGWRAAWTIKTKSFDK